MADDTHMGDDPAVLDPAALDPEADRESRRRARIWLWALIILIAAGVGVVSMVGRSRESSVKKAPKAFCKAAKAYENDIDRLGANYSNNVALQIKRVEKIAATAPKSVKADAELFLQSLRDYQAAPDDQAREQLKDDPEVKQAIVNVNRRWNQGCGVFKRDSGI